jgi:cell division septal protein FtsQ
MPVLIDKKIYRIILLFIALIFLTTFNPNNFYSNEKQNSNFFEVQTIEILNNNLIKETLIKEKVNNLYGSNIISISENDVKELLKEVIFFKTVKIKKKYPNTLIVKIYEAIPVGILFKNKYKYLLDSSSNLIKYDKNMYNDNLPGIFGEKAEANFIIFYEQLKKNKFPVKLIKNYYYFQIERWNLELFNNKTIKFPYENIKNAIIKSIELIEREDFKNYNTIDLRVDGKIIVE